MRNGAFQIPSMFFFPEMACWEMTNPKQEHLQIIIGFPPNQVRVLENTYKKMGFFELPRFWQKKHRKNC